MTAFAEPMAASCRHCGAALSRIDAGWIDDRGFLACVKAPQQIPGAPLATPVLHEPMPPGLRGAPDVSS